VKTIVCIGGRCSVWGKHFNRHMWTAKEIIDEGERAGEVITTKSDTCFRCGMTKKEAAND
jgi:hypothetical protein